jgi:3-oxoadipate enol-lactonase
LNSFSDNIRRPSTKDSNPAWIDASGVNLCYVLSGTGEAGTAVMIHELGGNIASWDAVAPTLRASLRVLTYDQRGHGSSEKVRVRFSLADHVDDLRALLDALAIDGPCWLIAAAAGAAIAVAFAARFPARVAGIVMCAPALDVDPQRRAYLQERAERARQEGMRPIVDRTLDQSWPPVLRGDRQSFEGYRSRLLANDPVGYALANHALGEIDLSTQLPTLRCPCLLLAGQYDLQRSPERVAAQAALVPGSVFDTVPAGHLMAVQRPAEVVEKIHAFIDRSRR